MTLSTTLTIETAPAASTMPQYEITQSIRDSSIYSDNKSTQSLPVPSQDPVGELAVTSSQSDALNPSIRLLFSLFSRRQFFLLILPAIISSVITGAIAPFMTIVVGQSFAAFAQFPLTPNPPQEAKNQLLHSVGIAALELVALACGSFALSSVTSSLWIWTGEHNAMMLRKRVYQAVTQKNMVWFDTKMDSEGGVQSTDSDNGPVGAGGLMAQFSRETDDVRMASSLTCGMILQYLTTTLAALAIAFQRSWSLTLVILSAVPALVLIQGFSQAVATPLLGGERSQTAIAATLVDRAVGAIATVKAFNAAAQEFAALRVVLNRIGSTVKRLSAVWGLTSSLSQFVMMAMFVQGFWFGAKLIRDGKASAGDVMTVFWACLISTSNLQMCIPQLIVLTKGKFAMASLLTLAESKDTTRNGSSLPPKGRKTTPLRKIQPSRCIGEFALHDVSFAYPSRPAMPVLEDVSIFLPANDTTFIVGGSGSGKSTIAQLLLKMYQPQAGMIQLDDQDISFVDDSWIRQNVAAVSQGCILFDMSVHDNVAMGLAGPGSGRKPEEATRDEVIEACRAALIHEFIRDLPDGYDTKLGNGGANLSGGQKQRLAIARARLRDPTVLILDEATSALDATSRILVFEAIKRWRQNKTTVVITHDLSQIASSDFVYVLKSGHVVEQGYRYDLETTEGEFASMMESQGSTGGFLPEKEMEPVVENVEEILEKAEIEKEEELEAITDDSRPFKHRSIRTPHRASGMTTGFVFADMTRPVSPTPIAIRKPLPIFVPADRFTNDMPDFRPRRPLSSQISPPQTPTTAVSSKHFSLPPTPSTAFTRLRQNSMASFAMTADDDEFDAEKNALNRSGSEANMRRPKQKKPRVRWEESKVDLLTIQVPTEPTAPISQELAVQQSFWGLIRDIYPTIPHKPLLFVGCILCLLSGAMTPIFSYLLSRLMFEVSIGASHISTINQYGGIVLGVAALDGLLMGLKYFIMETTAFAWVTRIRKLAFKAILAQDKAWFDKSDHSAVRMVQVLIKDGDDARWLIAIVLGQFLVVVAMLGVGLIWALVRGWQLTLVGFAIAPVFAGCMAIQTRLVARCELRNKRTRETVAKGYYETVSNIRGIRSMAFEGVFQEHFETAADDALSTGVRGAFVEGCTYGVANALIYLAEALLFYVGAVLIARGSYTYLQMVEVLNLVVFSVTIGSQLMAFTQRIAKSVQAARDFNQILSMPIPTSESRGDQRPAIVGKVIFDNVSFSYPERPDTTVLKNVSMKFGDGECVAIVGASGSGKSTVAALLQRLYEPSSGSIQIGHNQLRNIHVDYLRDHVSVVSQNPNLFDATISQNISYGSPNLSEIDVVQAARAANVHDFIMSLPHGYETMVGENASLISGGQAQRLSIARALARPSKILILDECTSALDPANQAAVLETVRLAKIGRTTIMVTHKLPVMKMCDRIIVVHEGEVAEQGHYRDLMSRNGLFAKLARGGEWVSE